MTEDMVSVSVLSSCSFDLLEYCSRGQIQGYVHPVREACFVFVVLRPGQHVRVLDSTYMFSALIVAAFHTAFPLAFPLPCLGLSTAFR